MNANASAPGSRNVISRVRSRTASGRRWAPRKEDRPNVANVQEAAAEVQKSERRKPPPKKDAKGKETKS